jgi:hypothetical protein
MVPSSFSDQSSARAVRDGELKPVIARVHAENFGVASLFFATELDGRTRR